MTPNLAFGLALSIIALALFIPKKIKKPNLILHQGGKKEDVSKF